MALRGAAAELDEDSADELGDNLAKLVGGKEKAGELLSVLRSGTPEQAHEVLSHLTPDVIEVLEQLMHLEQPMLKLIAYMNNMG